MSNEDGSSKYGLLGFLSAVMADSAEDRKCLETVDLEDAICKGPSFCEVVQAKGAETRWRQQKAAAWQARSGVRAAASYRKSQQAPLARAAWRNGGYRKYLA